MDNNSAMIPIYLNNDIINNLFTIVVHEFSEIKNIAVRDQTIFNATTPLSQLTCGKIAQGDLNIQFLQEKTNQTILENTSKIIVVLINLINLLEKKNLLTYINSNTDLSTLKENDFIGFSCKLNNNPTIENLEEMLTLAEMQITFNSINKIDPSNLINTETLNFLKNKITQCKECNCIRYITDNINEGTTKFIVPLQLKNMVDNIDYFKNNNITVVGKVTKIINNPTNRNICCSGTCLDYLNIMELFKSSDFYNDNLIFNENLRTTNLLIEDNKPIDNLIEIIPIAMYL